jgi:hypothetical protein
MNRNFVAEDPYVGAYVQPWDISVGKPGCLQPPPPSAPGSPNAERRTLNITRSPPFPRFLQLPIEMGLRRRPFTCDDAVNAGIPYCSIRVDLMTAQDPVELRT